MPGQYVVTEFASIRKNELVKAPETFDIHPDYLAYMSKDALTAAFHTVAALFDRLLTDIAADPALFGLPVYTAEMPLGGPDYNEARVAADWPFYLLLFLFAHGTLEDGKFIADISGFRQANKGPRAVKNIDVPLKALARYGFVFDGLKDYQLPQRAPAFEIAYPDRPSVAAVLHLMAAKCYRFLDKNGFFRFRTWNYRLLSEGRDEMTVGTGGDHLADSLHDAGERAFVLAFHDAVTAYGLTCGTGWRHEGPLIRYFDQKDKETYLFEESMCGDTMTLRLRIRNAEACMDYLETCLETVRAMFRETHPGCEKRANGTCTASTRYVYEGEDKWRCGCWGAAFFAPPIVKNIGHYIKLVELGKKKPGKK